ncbi:MAG: hypothetical protein HW387_624 [Parachlamydiales bacterium]|nr:hypothetical protein [Parachlamydiales bacterium]
MTKFLGRESELKALMELLQKTSASLVVFRGRRRIGKSRLAEEFAKQFSKYYIFSGLPPSKHPTADAQRAEFRRQMNVLGISSHDANDWADLFILVAKASEQSQTLVVLDEITWMGSKDPDFLGKLKIAWDLHFKKNPKLILILSGSNSAWIEKNILNSTGFVGRISYHLLLEELPLQVCNQFWGEKRSDISAYEKFKILGVIGGIPRYLEEILPNQTAEENIERLCFTRTGALFSEFDHIFTDLFGGRFQGYRAIVKCLVNGPRSLDEVAEELGRVMGGDLLESLDELEESGFLARDFIWHIKDGRISKLSRFRLRDNYLRFYLKYIDSRKEMIGKGIFKGLPVSWLSIMGLQFENLVLNHLGDIIKLLNIPSHEVVAAGQYLQLEGIHRKKCQIDLMIQTKYNQLYICEIKFAKREVGLEVVKEVKEKLRRLERPKGFSCRPVLFHVNGVMEAVWESECFSQIIDFGKLLEP